MKVYVCRFFYPFSVLSCVVVDVIAFAYLSRLADERYFILEQEIKFLV